MRRHLTPSLVISMIALFVALGGASYAAVKIPKNSVGSSQLKKNAVSSSKVKNASLLAEDFKAGQLPRGATGATGAAGATGATGAAGPTASASATASGAGPGVNLTPPNTYISVLNTSDFGSSGPLVLSVRSRVVVQASLSLFKGTGAADKVADVDCLLQSSPSAGGSFEPLGEEKRITLTQTIPGGAVYTNVSLTGSKAFDPGSYQFRARCQLSNGAGSLGSAAFENGDLTVIATGI